MARGNIWYWVKGIVLPPEDCLDKCGHKFMLDFVGMDITGKILNLLATYCPIIAEDPLTLERFPLAIPLYVENEEKEYKMDSRYRIIQDDIYFNATIQGIYIDKASFVCGEAYLAPLLFDHCYKEHNRFGFCEDD